MNKDQVVDRVLEMLMGIRFEKWHTQKFDDYITGEMKHKTGKSEIECLEEIRSDITNLLQLN